MTLLEVEVLIDAIEFEVGSGINKLCEECLVVTEVRDRVKAILELNDMLKTINILYDNMLEGYDREDEKKPLKEHDYIL